MAIRLRTMSEGSATLLVSGESHSRARGDYAATSSPKLSVRPVKDDADELHETSFGVPPVGWSGAVAGDSRGRRGVCRLHGVDHVDLAHGVAHAAQFHFRRLAPVRLAHGQRALAGLRG